MNTPPFLIGAALLFWGWQADLPWLGAVAGVLLEGARVMRARWEFCQSDLDRVWNLCVILFLGAAILAFASNDGASAFTTLIKDNTLAERSEALNKGARSVLLVFQWLPFVFLPIVLAQAFGQSERMDWSTFSWWLRRQRRRARLPDPGPGFAATCIIPASLAVTRSDETLSHMRPSFVKASLPRLRQDWAKAAALRQESCEPPHDHREKPLRQDIVPDRSESVSSRLEHFGAGLNVAWPYFVVCVLAASAPNERSLRFPIGLALLASWALWSRRSRGYSAWKWSLCLLLAVALGFAGQAGLIVLRGVMQQLESALVSRYAGGRNFDPKGSRTMLGAIGQLKLSGRIVLRVLAEGQPPPSLLREASYTLFKAPAWIVTTKDSANTAAENDETTWRFLPDVSATREATIAGFLPGGQGLLPLPLGAARLEELPAFVLETNRLGAVRVDSGPGYVRFRVAYGEGASIDGPPDSDDLDVPPAERSGIGQIADELNLRSLKPNQALQAVSEFFASRFRYSMWLAGETQTKTNQTALSAFLLKNRAGHCEYFATATTLLLRQAGIPTRYAVGYSVQEKKGRQWIVRERHAHAWCLAWIGGAWRDVDNTPGTWALSESERAPAWEAITDVWSRMRFAFGEWRWGKGGWKRYLIWLVIPLVMLGVWRLISQKKWKRAGRQASLKPAPATWPGLDSDFYRIERTLSKFGTERHPVETSSAWLDRMAKSGVANPAELRAMLALHYRLRFDPHGLNSVERAALRKAVMTWLGRTVVGPSEQRSRI